MSGDWRYRRERGGAFGLTLITWIALRLGRRVVLAALYPITLYYWLTAPAARRASRQYLERNLGRAARWHECYRHLLTFAIVSTDRIFFLAGRQHLFDVQVTGAEVFGNELAQGGILATAHFGSFDAMRVMGAGELTQPLRILLDVKHNARALELIQQLDPALARGVIDAGRPGPALALKVSEGLAEGALIGIMADRNGRGEPTTEQVFLGQEARFPTGLWQLASVLQAPVVACFGVYLGGNRYALHFELIATQVGASRRDRAQALDIAMTHYCQRLEHHARRYPFNWFNFYDFWHHDAPVHH